MNTLIYGQIGSGKTHFAVEQFVIKAIEQGRFVYTNIDFGVKWDFQISARFSEYLDKDVSNFIKVVPETQKFLKMLELMAYDEKGSHLPFSSVVVIDEAHQIFNYLKTNFVNKQVWEFLAYARHFNIDLVFITQSPELLSKFVINLCNNFIRVEGLKNVSSLMKNKYKIYVSNSLNSQPLEERFRTYNKDIFKLYKSYVADKDDPVFKRKNLVKGFAVPAFGFITVILLLLYTVTHTTFLNFFL